MTATEVMVMFSSVVRHLGKLSQNIKLPLGGRSFVYRVITSFGGIKCSPNVYFAGKTGRLRRVPRFVSPANTADCPGDPENGNMSVF